MKTLTDQRNIEYYLKTDNGLVHYIRKKIGTLQLR